MLQKKYNRNIIMKKHISRSLVLMVISRFQVQHWKFYLSLSNISHIMQTTENIYVFLVVLSNKWNTGGLRLLNWLNTTKMSYTYKVYRACVAAVAAVISSGLRIFTISNASSFVYYKCVTYKVSIAINKE